MDHIEIVLPTRSRSGRALGVARLRRWKQLLTAYLLDDLKVTGFQESRREGVWRQVQRELREYDPRTDLVSVVREEVLVLRTNDQEAVAYEARKGLVVLFSS